MKSLMVQMAYAIATAAAAVVSGSSSAAQPDPMTNIRLKQRVEIKESAVQSPIGVENDEHVLLVKININGHSAWAIIDNTLPHTAISDDFAKSIDLKPMRSIGKIDIGPIKLDQLLVDKADIVIPGHIAFRGQAVAIDMRPFDSFKAHHVQAIIGADYLDDLALYVESGRKRLFIGRAGAIKPQRKGVTVPLTEGNLVLAQVDHKPVSLSVDMGYLGNVLLQAKAWQRVIPADAIMASDQTAMPGRSQKSAIDVPVSLSGMSIVPGRVALSKTLPDDNDGLLGMAALGAFDFLLETSRRRLTLFPRP